MYLYNLIDLMNQYSEKDIPYADTFRQYISELNCREDRILYDKINNWLKYDREIMRNKYIRDPIHRVGNMELVLIIWNPNSTTPVHFHPHYGCLFRVVQGTLHTETYFDDDNSSVYKVDKTHVMREGDVDYTRGQHGIHRVFNPTNTISISLHLYIHRKPFNSGTPSLP